MLWAYCRKQPNKQNTSKGAHKKMHRGKKGTKKTKPSIEDVNDPPGGGIEPTEPSSHKGKATPLESPVCVRILIGLTLTFDLSF